MSIKKMNTGKKFDEKLQDEFYKDKELHAYSIDYLMKNEKAAIRLQLDNLVLTYGIDAVRSLLENTDLDVIRNSSKKVA